MGTIKIDGKTVEIESMLARQVFMCRNNVQVDVRLKSPGDVLPFIDAVNKGMVELVAKRIEKPVLLLERADVILREETAGRGVYYWTEQFTDVSIVVSLIAENDEARRFVARNVNEATFRNMVRNAVAELEKKSGKLTLTRAKEIVSEVAARFGFHYSVFSVSEDSVMVNFGLGDNLIPITGEDDFRREVICSAKRLQAIGGPSDWLGYNRIREIVRMECAKEGVACTVAQRPGAEEIEVSDCFGSQYKFTWIGGSADTLREEVRNAILAMRQASNKLTPEKMWQIVQEVCATDGERPWMIKNDDGSIREIHAYGYKWTTFSLLAYTTEQFRKVVTDARDKRSAVRINITNRSDAIDAAIYAMYRL